MTYKKLCVYAVTTVKRKRGLRGEEGTVTQSELEKVLGAQWQISEAAVQREDSIHHQT